MITICIPNFYLLSLMLELPLSPAHFTANIQALRFYSNLQPLNDLALQLRIYGTVMIVGDIVNIMTMVKRFVCLYDGNIPNPCCILFEANIGPTLSIPPAFVSLLAPWHTWVVLIPLSLGVPFAFVEYSPCLLSLRWDSLLAH